MQQLRIEIHFRRLILFLILIFLLPFIFGEFVNAKERWVASTFAENQQESITEVSRQLLAGEAVDLSHFDIIEHHEIWQAGNVVAYCVADYGIVPSSVCYGFLYSDDGEPHPAPDMRQYPLTITGKGVRYQQPEGDNFCELERITDHIFYYKLGY